MRQDDELTYSRYLGLEDVLTAALPVTGTLAEDHFIAAHQAIEIRFRVVIAAVREANHAAGAGRFDQAVRPLQRAAALLHCVLQEMSALDQSLTPDEFAQFRDALGAASGFESLQWRELELIAGLSADPWYMRRLHAMHAGHLPPVLSRAADEPTLRDTHHQARTAEHDPTAEQVADWIAHIDSLLMRWRADHMVMVRNKLGRDALGTGGRTLDYLAATLTPAVPAAWGPTHTPHSATADPPLSGGPPCA